jgi:hypothetical protein
MIRHIQCSIVLVMDFKGIPFQAGFHSSLYGEKFDFAEILLLGARTSNSKRFFLTRYCSLVLSYNMFVDDGIG